MKRTLHTVACLLALLAFAPACLALGHETLYQTDGVGRTLKITDPLGFDTRAEYNGVDQITKIIDPLLQETRITYDPAQRAASVIDPRNNAIESYQYDNGDRLTAVTDALNKTTNHQYDSAGRLSQLTDRKGQVITYAYDNLDRLITVNFPGITRSISYDVIGRVSRIEEPGSSVTYTYDSVDRVTSATTTSAAGQHTVGYEYDNIDRLIRRTVNGTDPTVYSYDNASRLTGISYRNQNTTYVWDGLNRLTSKTLPNGIRQDLAYDNADRLLSLTYKKTDDSLIETITYTYDAKGQRLTKSMSGASQRETPFTATYDAANRMSTFTLTATSQSYTLQYDDNGNLTTKTDTANATNITTYSWDSRNRLTGITAPGLTASFNYDVLNRRSEKTVNNNTLSYIYDGAQAIAEVTGGSVSAAILTGLNIDEVLARYSQSGNKTYLTDALGSVIAQASDTQAIENYYAYTPYGETTALGPDGGNPLQYTARENDGGLYYYRARYYDPVLKRFISSDPIGLAGGINTYAYVGGNPVSFIDPKGLLPPGADNIARVAWSEVSWAASELIKDFKPAPQSPEDFAQNAVLSGLGAAGATGAASVIVQGAAIGAGAVATQMFFGAAVAFSAGWQAGNAFNYAWQAYYGQSFGGSTYDFFNSPKQARPPSTWYCAP